MTMSVAPFRRVLLLGAVLALASATSAAQAGLRAIYVDIAKAKQLQIDVQDNGDARIGEVGSEDYGLLIGGQFYIVDREGGTITVARLKDVAAAMDQVLTPVFNGLFEQSTDAMPKAPLTVEPGEAGNAGGREGRVYHIKGLDHVRPDKPSDFLISSDEDLKPVGSALEGFMNAAVVPSAPLIGAMAKDLIAETRTIFSLGTPIDVGGRFRLNVASKAAFPSAYFRLPAQPQSVGSLVLSMKAAMAQKPQ